MESKRTILRRTTAFALAFVMAFSLLFTGSNTITANAAAAVTSIKVAKSKVTLAQGKGTNIKVTVKGSNKKFTVKSSNKKVATAKAVGKKVNITAKGAGKATITVTTKGKNRKGKKLKKTIKVTVPQPATTEATTEATTAAPTTAAPTTEQPKTEQPKTEQPSTEVIVKEVKSIVVPEISLPNVSKDVDDKGNVIYKVAEGESIQLPTPVIEPADSNQKVTYTSSDETIATVDANGKVTVIKSGNVTIEVVAGGKSTPISLNVTKREYDIAIDGEDKIVLGLEDGYNTKELVATVAPTGSQVEWTASKSGIIVINQTETNKVTISAQAAGEVVLTAVNGTASDTIKVVVTATDYVQYTEIKGIAEGSFELTATAKHVFSESGVIQSEVKDSTLILTKKDDPNKGKTFTATYESINDGVVKYKVNPGDFVVSGHYGELDGTYTVSAGKGDYVINTDGAPTVTYTEKENANRITGRVVDSYGVPISDVSVKTLNGYYTTTDENGYYDVASSNGSNIEVTYIKEGYFEKKDVAKVGAGKSSVINEELEYYKQDEVRIIGELDAIDYNTPSNDASQSGFLVELQKQQPDGTFSTIRSISTIDTGDSTIKYAFANDGVKANELNSAGVYSSNRAYLPEELSISSDDIYQIVISKGMKYNDASEVYPTKTIRVSIPKTSREIIVNKAEMRQITPIKSLKIAKDSIYYAGGANTPDTSGGTDIEFILLATNGDPTTADTFICRNSAHIDVESNSESKTTNKSEIDLLDVFGNPDLEFPKTDSDNRYFLVMIDDKDNAYNICEVVISVAGAEIELTSKNITPFKAKRSTDYSYLYSCRFSDTSDEKNAINGGNVYSLDVDHNRTTSSQSVQFKVYQVINGVKVYLSPKNVALTYANKKISAGGDISRLSADDTYVVYPENNYIEDTEITLAGDEVCEGSSKPVANIGYVVITDQNKLSDEIFVNSVSLLDSTGKAVRTKVVNDIVESYYGEFTIDVSDAFTKIPRGTYRLQFDVSGYDKYTTDEASAYDLVGFEQADLELKDKFELVSKTGVVGTVIDSSTSATITGVDLFATLYSMKNGKVDKIVAYDKFDDGNFSMQDGVDDNEIAPGTYKLVIRGADDDYYRTNYATFALTITLAKDQTKLFNGQDSISMAPDADGIVELYAKNSATNESITKLANVAVVAKDQHYLAPTADNCINIDLFYNVVAGCTFELGQYDLGVDGEHFVSEPQLSAGSQYTVEVTSPNLVTTEYPATVQSGNSIFTIKDKTIEYVQNEQRTWLHLTYTTVNSAQFIYDEQHYIVLKDADGKYIETYVIPSGVNVDNYSHGSTQRTVDLNIPTGTTGYLYVYTNDHVVGKSDKLTNYNTEGSLLISVDEQKAGN